MDLDISGRIALVTGAGRGLGRSVAKQLSREGAVVVAVSRSPEPLESLQAELNLKGDRHRTMCVDLMEDGAPAAVVESVLRDVGMPDIVVHNLGGSFRVTDPLAPWTDWQKVWRLNLGIVVEINNLLIPQMTDRKWGRLVHVSSSAAVTFQGYAPYVTAKAALNAYVRTVSRVVAKSNVVMSAVMPGPIRLEGRYLTRMEAENAVAWADYAQHHLPIGRLAADEEIASTVLFLCSSGASYCVGSLLPVDGGVM